MTVRSVDDDVVNADWFDKSEKHHAEFFRIEQVQLVFEHNEEKWKELSDEELRTLSILLEKVSKE